MKTSKKVYKNMMPLKIRKIDRYGIENDFNI